MTPDTYAATVGENDDEPEPTAHIVEIGSDEYHADKSRVSRSMLVDFMESPVLYNMRHKERHPDWQQEATKDMRFGTLFHAIVLEGKRFDQLVKIIPEHVLSSAGERRGKEYEKWAAITPDAASYLRPKDTDAEMDLLAAMQESMRDCAPARELLAALPHPILGARNPHEVTIHWEYEGIECRTRLDRLNHDCIVDIKTARACSLTGLQRTIEADGLYIQNALYEMAVESLTGQRLPMRFAFVEKGIPRRTVVVELSRKWIDQGRLEVEDAFYRLQKAGDKGDWRDPSSASVLTLSRPKWGEYKLWLDDEEDVA